ncbi:MAG: hypothetical protein ACTSU5_07665 [Promethearchaeota archaeon]
MIFLDNVSVTIQRSNGAPPKTWTVKALVDSGSGGIVIPEELLEGTEDPYYGPDMAATGFGGVSRTYKTVLVLIEAPGQPFPVLLPAYVSPREYFPPPVREQKVDLILGNPWFALVGVLIEGERVVGYAGGTIG